MYPDPFAGEPAPDLSTVGALIDELERQASLLTAVATGGPRIEYLQWEYQERRRRLTEALQRRGLEYPHSRGRTSGSGTASGRGIWGTAQRAGR
jgi:hypothetical protein